VGPRVTRLLYFAVLLSILSYVAVYAIDRSLNVNARGHVEVSRVVVASARGGRITELPAAAGSRVDAGQPIVGLELASPCAAEDDRELQRLRRQIDVDRARMAVLVERRGAKRTAARQLELYKALELDQAAARELARLEDDVEALDGDIVVLKAEIAAKTHEGAALASRDDRRPECEPEVLSAPRSSTVVAVLREPFEVVDRGDPIMVLAPADARVRVRAYLGTDSVSALGPGQSVTVQLPDGIETAGSVTAIESSARPFADTEYDVYQPAATEVLVWIDPRTQADAQLWRGYDRMDVQVRARR
jgi:multidrug resistance efflux pump